MSLIKLHDITKSYITGETTLWALNHVDFTVESHDFIAIIGESGSGKSTMMHIIGLLDRPTSGSYQLNDREVSTLNDDELALLRNEKIGFAFQSFFLLPRFDSITNIMLPLLYRGVETAEAKKRAFAILEKMEIAFLANHKPNEMSGGQQQRIALARALVGNPDILLADEPTGALDSETSAEIMGLFLKLHHDEKKTVIIVTHDMHVANKCQRIVTMKDGKIIEDKINPDYRDNYES